MDTGVYMANQMDDLITAGIMQKDYEEYKEMLSNLTLEEKIFLVKEFLEIRKVGFEKDLQAYVEYIDKYADDPHFLDYKLRQKEVFPISEFNQQEVDDLPF